jgi:hypothetical protein
MIGEHDLHKSLKSEIVAKINAAKGEIVLVKLAWGKGDIGYSLHVRPNTFSLNGIQIPDFLSYLGFSRQSCSFLLNECYVKRVEENLDINAFGQALDKGYEQLTQAERYLMNCGFMLSQPEGWGYFYGKQSGTHSRGNNYYGDGHTSAVTPEVMKRAEDDVFDFIFTWIKNGENDKGWTIHYHPKHPPLSVELQSVFRFLGIKDFSECPQFDFEPCSWRHIVFQQRGAYDFDSNADFAHRCFESHKLNFSPGLKSLLAAQEIMEKVGMGFLPSFERPEIRRAQEIIRHTDVPKSPKVITQKESPNFDVAISFAGTERKFAEDLATRVKTAGFKVFYDDFYQEDLWGKNLVEFFHEIYSKHSRYCVIFVSNEYLKREWTVHERRSAQERMLKEKGNEYILPIQMEDVDLPGIPSTIGYLPISTGIDKIAEILIKKLKKEA